MKEYKFKNKKVINLIKRKEEIAEIINKMNEKWQEEDKKAKKLMMEMDRIKDKINPIIADEVKKGVELEEFDVISSAKYKKDEVIVSIANMIEMYKEQLRKQKDGEKKTKS